MTKRLQALQIDEDTVIYVETIDDVEVPAVIEEPEEQTRGGQKGWSRNPSEQMAQSFKAIESTIKVYTKHTLNAFRDAALADVQKVTLEFGVNVSGVGGVPYIATGTMGCNIKVTVECAFPQRKPPASAQSAVPQSQPQPQSQPPIAQPLPRQPHPNHPTQQPT
ncbi:CU044_2847 family protein [Egbenema bharatensis]|uniref:CU044_2847 family protein n=1 Tax=Egbenema bharatensis TaxID=3463334 RepID=UPI003A874EBD